MVIEENILVNAGIERVWKVFTDLTCWKNWNSVIRNVCCGEQYLSHARTLKCCFRPFSFPINVEINIERVEPNQYIAWSVRKKGFVAYHEFLFQKDEDRVLVTSRETFSGLLLKVSKYLLPRKRMRILTSTFLYELKVASESHS